MKLVNVYAQPSQIYRFEFTNIKPTYSSFILMSNELHAYTAHTLTNYSFLTKVIPYENIAD